ncbi:hypothetical protein PRIPAC_87150 [Pristionchus pacificus]|uniref:Uncharacterized protein n=1 Tax=Pristionchus pacificus TaxID=54126 RepID=A0A2A6CZA4_PRIPA|nr:hypothetical protein PRIPAC_87150 [Pristionchus pacificus]|eukprot:PDM83426.1 hypothetical protein PRIPAC_35058 [Pristionchus pacificus]
MADGAVPQQYWNALLGMTTRATADYNDSNPSQSQPSVDPGPLSDESRQWLESALRDVANSTDPGKILDGLMGSLLRYAATSELEESDIEKVTDLGLRLEDLLQCADLAGKFQRSGGFEIIMRFLNYMNYAKLRSTGCQMLITMCENNPQAQNLVIAHPLFKHIFDLLCDTKQDSNFRYKLLGSVSAIVRSHAPAFDAFTGINGHSKMREVAISPDNEERVAHKAARVLASIAYTYRDDPARKNALKETIVQVYTVLATRREEEDTSELCFVREFILSDILSREVSGNTKQDLLKALKEEEKKQFDEPRQQQIIGLLMKKFSKPQ